MPGYHTTKGLQTMAIVYGAIIAVLFFSIGYFIAMCEVDAYMRQATQDARDKGQGIR